MYVASLSLSNVRCFPSVPKMAFQHPGRTPRPGEPPVPQLPNVNLLLGNNGAGKSTILKSVALAMIAPVLEGSGYRPYNVVRQVFKRRRGAAPQRALIDAEVVLTGQDVGRKSAPPQRDSLFVELTRREDNDAIVDRTPCTGKWLAMERDRSPAFLVMGYGATRRMAPPRENIKARGREAHLRYQRVRSLFEDDFSLVPLSYWFATQNKGRRTQVVNLINELLEGQYRFDAKEETGEYVFDPDDGSRVPLQALSDGFRGFLSWVMDMLYHVCEGIPSGTKLRDVEGMVMVDEIDLHLHPAWQRTIIGTLSRAFPRMQFLFTSHSPLVTGSMEWPNIWVMSGDKPTQLPDEPIHGLSADQVLLSPYFGVHAVRSDEKMQRLADLEVQARRGNVSAAHNFMRELSTGSEAEKYGGNGGAATAAAAAAAAAPATPVDADPAGWAAAIATSLKDPPAARPGKRRAAQGKAGRQRRRPRGK